MTDMTDVKKPDILEKLLKMASALAVKDGKFVYVGDDEAV
jgi:predicted amidohydrolase YtcJ